MNTKEAKSEIKRLKQGLKSAKRATNVRLLRYALIMLILAIVAAFMYGRIQL